MGVNKTKGHAFARVPFFITPSRHPPAADAKNAKKAKSSSAVAMRPLNFAAGKTKNQELSKPLLLTERGFLYQRIHYTSFTINSR